MKFSRKFQLPQEGCYQATVIGWKKGEEKKTAMGPTPSAMITFELENGQRVMQSMLVYPGPTSLVQKLFDATIGENADDVSFDELIGKECGIEVKHNITDDKTYANVVDVFPVSEFEDDEAER